MQEYAEKAAALYPVHVATDRGIAAERHRGTSERVDDPRRIREIVEALVRHRAKGVLRNARGAFGVETTAYSAEVGAISFDVAGPVENGPFVVELEGLNTMFHLRLDRGLRSGDRLVTGLPTTILRLRRRWLRRAATTSRLSVSGAHVSSAELLCGPVRDVSYQGLAIELDEGASPLAVGAVIDRLRISDDKGRCATLTVEVRSIVPSLVGGCVYGLEVVGASPTDAETYVKIVDDQLHPGTQMGSAWAEAMWDLYERCGYFTLSGKEPRDFHQLRRAFLHSARELDAAPHLGCHVVWPATDGKETAAALSALKVYSGAWLGFQMAKRKGDVDGVSSRAVLREINLRVYEHVQRDPRLRWVIGYLQTKRAWSALVHLEFPKRYQQSADAAIIRFRALEVAVEVLWPLDAGPQVGVATAAELTALAASVAHTRPAAYGDALDLVPERMDLADNKNLWHSARYERDRCILVARQNGTAVAAAVLELGAEGAHLFGLLDLVRLYPLTDGGDAAFPHLLEAAKSWYRDRDRSRYVCMLEEGLSLPTVIIDLMVDMGEADMTILAARRVPDLLEHLYEVTAPRLT